MNEDWLSAHLDGELSASEAAEVAASLLADPALQAQYDDLARVRAVVRGSTVEIPSGSPQRIVRAVEEAPDLAPVVSIAHRRRVPSMAAVAAAVVIIASVVGGVGGGTAVPALGDLVERHEAAAVESEDFMADAVEMPMAAAADMGPAMPSDYAMQHAFVDGPTLHLVYLTSAGAAVSVFRQDGEADMDALPDGKMSSLGSHDMWSSTHGATHVAVVDGSGFVWTIVAAEPQDTMMVAMMDDLPTREPGLAERLRDAADAVVEPFRFWD